MAPLMRLELSPLAQSDLETIGDYIAKDSPLNALRFVEGLRSQCQRIVLSPLGYPARAELGENLRSCAYGRYIVFFTPIADLVRIERILHSALDIRSELLNPDSSD